MESHVQQIKIFKGVESELELLEKTVNDWIRDTSANVLTVAGNIAPQSESLGSSGRTSSNMRYAPSDVILIITYAASD